MNRKIIIWLLTTALLSTAPFVEAQQPGRSAHIGYLADSTAAGSAELLEVFRQQMSQLGWVEGKNLTVEHQFGEGKGPGRLAELAAELVRVKLDVIVVAATSPALAAKEATKTIPIVMVTGVDPVAMGIVDSLARPGGNLTGLTTLARDLSGKRLELLKEAVPGISRVGVLWDANAEAPTISFKEYEAAARALKIPLQSLEVPGPNPDLEGAFQTAAKKHANALITISNPVLSRYTKRLAELAIKNRLPSIYERNQYVETGGLMSYSSNVAESYRRAAIYVDKILKGAKPADLPVEQPTKFEFIINLKAAKQIGLTIPPNVLARADRVIR